MDKQNGVRIVEIVTVDTNRDPYPTAYAKDYTGAEFEINLSFIPPGLTNVPDVGEIWHIENRFGRFWTLMNKSSNSVVGLSAGDLIPTSEIYKVGDTGPGGGIIFFVDRYNEYAEFTYLEVAPAPAGTEVQKTWATNVNSNQTTAVSGADSRALGAGYQNTLDIVAQTGNVAGTCAARYCADFTSGGQSDWYLPSISEIQLVRYVVHNELGVGGFVNQGYWSSTEVTASTAWYHTFHFADFITQAKSQSFYVRPVRRF
jgi:hypothetical protein